MFEPIIEFFAYTLCENRIRDACRFHVVRFPILLRNIKIHNDIYIIRLCNSDT